MSVSIFASAPENFRAGRPDGIRADAIVLHRSGGSRVTLRSRFGNPAAGVSAHYIVGRDGSVDQCVAESDTAFHAGLIVAPTWAGLRPKVNPNFHTIAIEFEGESSDGWPDLQIAAAAELIAAIAHRWQFPVDADHVVLHSAIRAGSACPASTLPLGRLLTAAQDHPVTTRAPRDTVVRLLVQTNVRAAVPSRQGTIARVMPAGIDVRVAEFTDAGEPVQGNSCWYGDGDGNFFWAGATSVPTPVADDGVSATTVGSSGSTDGMELGRPPATPAAPAAPGAPGVVIDRTTMVLAAKEFFSEAFRKDLIVLHFTAGTTARSAFDTWRNDPQHVATAYIVDLDGTIFEVFPPRFWAGHLGVKGDKNATDRRSIGIEIANVGPLQRSTEDPSVLNWWPKKAPGAADFTTKFCRLDETSRYVTATYRQKSHFASFPDVQVTAVAGLVRALCAEFSIPASLPPLSQRFDCDLNRFATYKGVCTHANFRQDKWDIGPGFQWDQLGL